MQNTLLMLCRLGTLPPLLFSVAAALILAVIELLSSSHAPFRPLLFAGTICTALVLLAALIFVFRRIWASAIATAVAWFWLIWGIWDLRAAQLHPSLYRYNDGEYALLLIIPCGLIGSVSATAVLLSDWAEHNPSSSRTYDKQ